MFFEEENEEKEFIQVNVKGKDPILWARLKSKFLEKVQQLLETEINTEDHTNIKEEAKIFTTELLKFAKEKLKQQGLENQKTLAEIEQLYSKCRLDSAEVRIKNAQAEELEFKNKLNNIKLSMGLMKALLIDEEDEENIIFIKRIDTFMGIIKEFNMNS